MRNDSQLLSGINHLTGNGVRFFSLSFLSLSLRDTSTVCCVLFFFVCCGREGRRRVCATLAYNQRKYTAVKR